MLYLVYFHMNFQNMINLNFQKIKIYLYIYYKLYFYNYHILLYMLEVLYSFVVSYMLILYVDKYIVILYMIDLTYHKNMFLFLLFRLMLDHKVSLGNIVLKIHFLLLINNLYIHNKLYKVYNLMLMITLSVLKI